jgi:hypothetical protein
MNNKVKYMVKVEYENGDVWVLIRTWNKEDSDNFYEKEKKNGIESLTLFRIEDFDKDDNTGWWWKVYDPKRSV